MVSVVAAVGGGTGQGDGQLLGRELRDSHCNQDGTTAVICIFPQRRNSVRARTEQRRQQRGRSQSSQGSRKRLDLAAPMSA